VEAGGEEIEMASDPHDRRTPRQVALLDDLEALFTSEGFRHLTVGDMAARTESSRRTLYGVAPSKEELVLVVVDRFFNRMGKDARWRASRVVDIGDKIEAYLSASVDRNLRLSAAFIQDIESYAPTRQLYDRHQELAVAALEAMIREAMELGTMRPGSPALLAEIIDAVIRRLRDPETLSKIGATRADALKAFGQLLREGIV
jgi:AcrR family transcriptional regulator